MIYYLGVDILKAGNISREPEKTVQHDNELSFEEKIRRCSEAIHSGKAIRSKSRYHFLVETEDGEELSLGEDELKAYLKNKKTIQRPEQPAYLMETEDGIVTNIYGQNSTQSSVSSSESPPPPFKEAPVSNGPIKKVRRSTIMLWILSALLACVSALALFFAFRCASLESSLSKTMSDLEQSISKCQAVSNARDQLRDTVYEYSDEINFWRSHVVITTEFGEKYHTYGCQYIKNSDILWFMNVGVARVRGYEACSVCRPAIPPY